MSDEKKYSAKEAALAVLKKAEEMLTNSELLKGKKEDFARLSANKELGVHKPAQFEAPVYHQEGKSRAGLDAKSAKRLIEGSSQSSVAQRNPELAQKRGHQAMNRVKDAHREKLDELKAMPKPSLPKSESENEIGTKFEKSAEMKKDEAMPAGEIHPKEHMEGEAEKPGKRIESQVAPEDNPKEAQEGNNNEWGTQPATYGTLKLAHFLGRVHTKRSQKSKIVSPDAKAVMDPKNK